MNFEIIREINYPFVNINTDEEQWGELIDVEDINEAVKHLKNDKGLFSGINCYEFSEIDEENQCAYFTITNRDRYVGDDFIIRPFD